MGLDETVTPLRRRALVAGIGFRRGASPGEIVALIRQALATAGIAPNHLTAIATARDRAEEASLRAAATTFGLVPMGFDTATLAAQDAALSHRSPRITALRGIGCLCEAAALAGAGPGGHLAVARVATGSVTCALAFGAETHENPRS